MGIAEPLKRKLEEDIFQKMLHPTFKVSKLDPKIKKEKRLLTLPTVLVATGKVVESLLVIVTLTSINAFEIR